MTKIVVRTVKVIDKTVFESKIRTVKSRAEEKKHCIGRLP